MNDKDTIYRQTAIDEIDEWIKAFRENGHKESAADACLIQDGIIQLPSAQQDFDIDQKINKAYDDGYDQGYLQCRADQERTTGHWIEITNNRGTVIALRCSCCKKSPKHAIKSDFCPNCGSPMEGVVYDV